MELSLTECRDVPAIATTFRNTPASTPMPAPIGAESLFVRFVVCFRSICLSTKLVHQQRRRSEGGKYIGGGGQTGGATGGCTEPGGPWFDGCGQAIPSSSGFPLFCGRR